ALSEDVKTIVFENLLDVLQILDKVKETAVYRNDRAKVIDYVARHLPFLQKMSDDLIVSHVIKEMSLTSAGTQFGRPRAVTSSNNNNNTKDNDGSALKFREQQL